MFGSALVVILGLGVGAVAYYNGNPLLKSRVGPEEFTYIPADASAVAYANVSAIVSSQFTQKLREVLPTGEEKARLQAELGIDIDRDIDSVIAGTNGSGPGENGIVLVRGRFNQGHLEALAVQHGGTAEDYKGKKLIVFGSSYIPRDPDPAQHHAFGAISFLEPGLVAFGDRTAIQRAIDANEAKTDLTRNAELMKLIGEVQAGSDAWVVGNFDSIRQNANMPAEIREHIPAVQWLAVSVNVNGGLNGVVRAEARDDKAGEELRAVVNGALAAGRLVSGQDKRIEAMLNAVQVSGMGKTAALSFTIPPEVLDIINGVAAMKNLHEGSHVGK
jgi:hypothetical protein